MAFEIFDRHKKIWYFILKYMINLCLYELLMKNQNDNNLVILIYHSLLFGFIIMIFWLLKIWTVNENKRWKYWEKSSTYDLLINKYEVKNNNVYCESKNICIFIAPLFKKWSHTYCDKILIRSNSPKLFEQFKEIISYSTSLQRYIVITKY